VLCRPPTVEWTLHVLAINFHASLPVTRLNWTSWSQALYSRWHLY